MKSRLLVLCLALTLVCASAGLAANEPKVDSRFFGSTFAVSPDGTRIAYPVPSYDDFGSPVTQVWVSKLDGSDRKQVATMPDYWNISWYDKSHVAASQFDVNRIHILPIGKGKRRSLSLTDNFYWATISISPDGKWVAFNAIRKDVRKAGVFVLNTATGEVKKLSDDLVKSYVEWSPDSAKIVYGKGGYGNNYDLKVVDVATAVTTDLGVKGVGARWSPDGKWIAYTGNIVRGGSWYNGVPIDGAIVKTNLESKTSVTLTDDPVNIHDEKAGKWEVSGAISPQWSRDGNWIAYRRRHTVMKMPGYDHEMDEDQIWVMNSDGSGKRKVSDRWMPMAWAPDGKSLFLKDENGITRVMLDSEVKQTIATWSTPEIPAPKESDFKTIQSKHAVVEYAWVDPKWAKAILKIAETSRDIYANELHADMPDVVTVRIERVSGGRTNLWTDGESTMFLTIKSEADLAPPQESGVWNIYGISHELGHIAMYRRARMLGFPKGVAEGWAHYAGSAVTDEVYKKLGKNVWPVKYDYSEDGLKRLEKTASDPEALKDPVTKAAAAFYQAQQKYGLADVFASVNEALAGKPYGKDVMPLFIDALVKRSGDEKASQMFSEDLIVPKVEWKVASREINDQTTEGLIQEPDAGGITLKYDKDKSDGQRSTAGSGHAIMFKTPAGKWAVDGVSMFGSRYGEEIPPKDNFSIFILDGDFNVIKEVQEPYAKLERGDNKWYRFDFDPVSVPEGFYVCIYFDATYTKGFYMNYERKPKFHSKSALPWSFVYDVGDDGIFDWMIRAHLKRVGE